MSLDQYETHTDADCCGANRNDGEKRDNAFDRTIIPVTEKISGELVVDLQGNGSLLKKRDRTL